MSGSSTAIGTEVIDQRRRLKLAFFPVGAILEERRAQPVHDAAAHLLVDQHGVHDAAAILNAPMAEQRDRTGFNINFQMARLNAVGHVIGAGRAGRTAATSPAPA